MTTPIQRNGPRGRPPDSSVSPSSTARRRPSITGISGIPRSRSNSRAGTSRIAVARNANTQPTYDFLAGGAPSPPQARQTFRQSQVVKPDHANEGLRAEIKALQYELSTFKQEKELTEIRHEKELREAQKRAEADFKRAQASESESHVATLRYDALVKELRDAKDQAADEKTKLEKKLRESQEQARTLQEEVDEAQTDLSSQERQHKHLLSELETRCTTLTRTADELRSELGERATAAQSAQQRLSERDTSIEHLENEILRLKAQTGDADTLGVIKRELSEQVAHIKKLELANREQLAELKQHRKHRRAVEVVEEEKRLLEARLRQMDDIQRELGEAQLQRQILLDERQAWTGYLQNEANGEVEFDSPEELAKALMSERVEKVALMERLGAVTPELAEKDDIIKGLESDKAKWRHEAEKLRAAAGGLASSSEVKKRARLERQRALAVKEVEYLRAQLKTFDAEDATFNLGNLDEQKKKQVQELEDLVDQYRTELHILSEELAAREQSSSPREPTASIKRPRDEEPDERLGQLSRKNRKLQEEVTQLHQTTTLLQKDLEVSQSQLHSLQSSSRTRILELRSNPTADAFALRTSTLAALRAENTALLSRLEANLSHPDAPPTDKLVPLATLERLRADIADLQRTVADRDKRMTRLKQIWSAKSLEFREAVASILGWKLDFMPNGRVRVTSMFSLAGAAPGSDEAAEVEAEQSIVFDGEVGSMKVSGGPEGAFGREIRSNIRFWVEERKEIPCFLAALTLEFYERTTRAVRM